MVAENHHLFINIMQAINYLSLNHEKTVIIRAIGAKGSLS